MLQNLHVKNLFLIDEINVDFAKGLNILTGETGAGKSLILGSIILALGGRFSSENLRNGVAFGLVELIFSIEHDSQRKALKQEGIFPEEDDTVTISRKFMQGKSTNRINGEMVSIAELKTVADVFLDMYGQHEHQELLYKKNHLKMLDLYAKQEVKGVLQDVKNCYGDYKKCLEEADSFLVNEEELKKEEDFLKYEVMEISEIDIKEEEDTQLEKDYRKMSYAKKIIEATQKAYEYTAGANIGGAQAIISHAIKALQEVVQFDEQANELYEQLTQIDDLLNDFNRELSGYVSDMEYAPEEFEKIENRLNAINRLKTKYGQSIEEIHAYKEKCETRLEEIQNHEIYKERAIKQLEKSKKELEIVTAKLTKLRKMQAKQFEAMIIDGLGELNFELVNFKINFKESADYTGNGKDDIEFFISLNAGESLKPLKEVASGGELSRIMLAIKTLLAEKDEIGTLVFDEIDVGISGRTAQKVSEKMALIAKHHQVLCITHLAQIAAMADTHFLIQKNMSERDTNTQIYPLSEEESIEEIARILGGAKITDTVYHSAKEMKIFAEQIKNQE